MAQVQNAVHQPTWELVLKRNSIERFKQEKFPLDIVDELPTSSPGDTRPSPRRTSSG
jgi:hypothetical protein